jgi:alpha-tubulin suppressor-like RCC1 family protein
VDLGERDWDEDGRLWGCGSNFHGQLRLRQETLETLCLSLVPLLTLGGQRVHSMSVGLAHSIICTSNGSLFATGCNSEGQLGTGDFTSRFEFVAVHGGSDPKLQCRASLGPCSLAAGGWHSLAIDPEGSVWAWGSLIGTPPTSLADGDVGRAQAPVPGRFHPETFELEKVCAVSAGHYTTPLFTIVEGNEHRRREVERDGTDPYNEVIFGRRRPDSVLIAWANKVIYVYHPTSSYH